MAYVHGNLAEQLDHAEELQRTAAREVTPRPHLSVVTGTRGRQHAEARLSPLATTALKAAVAVVACVVVISMVRIGVIAATYSVLSENNALLTSLDEARSLGSELEVQQSILGSSERVKSIATEVYGMVSATTVSTIDVSSQVAAADTVTTDQTSQGTAE